MALPNPHLTPEKGLHITPTYIDRYRLVTHEISY